MLLTSFHALKKYLKRDSCSFENHFLFLSKNFLQAFPSHTSHPFKSSSPYQHPTPNLLESDSQSFRVWVSLWSAASRAALISLFSYNFCTSVPIKRCYIQFSSFINAEVSPFWPHHLYFSKTQYGSAYKSLQCVFNFKNTNRL